MDCVINTILESEGSSSPASYPIHMHSEPAKYVQASLWCNWYQHIAYVGVVPKVLYPNCCGGCRRLGSLQSCVVLWKPFLCMTTNLIEEMAYGWLNLMTHSGSLGVREQTYTGVNCLLGATGGKKQVWRVEDAGSSSKCKMVPHFQIHDLDGIVWKAGLVPRHSVCVLYQGFGNETNEKLPFLPYKKGCIWTWDQDEEMTKQT